MAGYEIVTIEELLEACKEQVAKGNGKKQIILSGDDEGNNYHACYYLFSETAGTYTCAEDMRMSKEQFSNCVILG